MIISLLVSGASAGEFGNVSADADTTAASRDASATALTGVEQTIAGLKERELQLGSGATQFKQAATSFLSAADKMDSVLKTLPDEHLSQAQVDYLKTNFNTGSFPGVQEAKSIRDVYARFAEKTRQMAGLLDGLAEQENAFAIVSPILIDYFRLADGIVALRRVPVPK
ncbi:hypothetical protein ASD99_13860 [Mesorhizobium sp. Root695]|nr:hypothetical protein ASD99_13860 [Mesorhizobium sp. Root695]